jgi:uncharacterized membrane protein
MYVPSLITTIQLQTTQSIFSELNEKQAQELNKVMNYQLLFIFLKFNIVIPQSLILFPPSIAKKHTTTRENLCLIKTKNHETFNTTSHLMSKTQFYIISVRCLKVSLDGQHSPSSMCLLS